MFGPVLASRTFKTEEEAVAIANDSEYGLAAAVISSDPERYAFSKCLLFVHVLTCNPCSNSVHVFTYNLAPTQSFSEAGALEQLS